MNKRQRIVLCDGTNNTLTSGVRDTNVLQLACGLRITVPQKIVARILNALGMALLLYLAADVSENLLTGLFFSGHLWTELSAWITPFITLASGLKFASLGGVGVLLVRAGGGEVNLRIFT